MEQNVPKKREEREENTLSHSALSLTRNRGKEKKNKKKEEEKLESSHREKSSDKADNGGSNAK